MSLISRAFSQPEKRNADFSSTLAGIPSWASHAQSDGDGIGGHGAMSITAFFSCVRILADAVSSLPIGAYKQSGNAQVLVDPQPTLLRGSPYPGLTMRDWLWMMMRSLAVSGNAFAYVTARGPDGRPTALLPVHHDQVQISLNTEQGQTISWTDPIYRIGGKQIPNADIVHIKRYPEAGCPVGMSPIDYAAGTINLSLAADRYGLRWFRDSANPSGVLSSKDDLTPLQVKQNQLNWIAGHQGNRYPAMLGNGLQWQSLSISPEESQFLQTRHYQRSDIGMWFGIPPHMLGDIEKQTSYGTGVEQQSISFTTYTLGGWLSCVEQALSLLIPNNQFIKLDIDGLLRGDIKARWEAYGMGRNSGVLSVNDINAMEGRPPIGPEGDIRIQPMNYIPLGTPVSEYLGKSTPDTPPAKNGE